MSLRFGFGFGLGLGLGFGFTFRRFARSARIASNRLASFRSALALALLRASRASRALLALRVSHPLFAAADFRFLLAAKSAPDKA